MKTVWQIAAGESGRYYDDLFPKHDVMFLGPGTYGRYPDDNYRKAVIDNVYTPKKIGGVKHFAESVKVGHVVLLRKRLRVTAIGVIHTDGYDWKPTFDDVYGWDLQHTQRVIWQDHLGPDLEELQNRTQDIFADRIQIPTFTGVDDPKVLGPIEPLLEQLQERPLRD